MKIRYRFEIMGKGQAPWRDTRDEAVADALAAGMAERDEQYDRVFLIVPAEIATQTIFTG